jgi:hypothetical protein
MIKIKRKILKEKENKNKIFIKKYNINVFFCVFLYQIYGFDDHAIINLAIICAFFLIGEENILSVLFTLDQHPTGAMK